MAVESVIRSTAIGGSIAFADTPQNAAHGVTDAAIRAVRDARRIDGGTGNHYGGIRNSFVFLRPGKRPQQKDRARCHVVRGS